ncbi:MAG: hypothetical protein JSR91_24735 [Proteobacteria bacterium]|nr:hypothetical protein [Pseudomonadota bacterium]
MRWFAALVGWLMERFGRKAQVTDDQAKVIRDVEARNAVEADVARAADPNAELVRRWSRD